MNCLRFLARAAAPTALLVGLAAAPAMASDTPAPNTPATVSTSPVKAQVKTWHWMGNYGSVYDVANAANGFGAGAGELITQDVGNGLYATFMYY
ncbi:hypothetical protein LE181_18305 [Streptomyces sp. SCA3-4]|uniref:hypothetical protein n=1 Tax=Streptomyces sichuanensis TaxID=2871810 RepID=UPI001CE25446|nr:hypothetical protein [Streptomyces sichuanensis]MCA6094107.1 hypothetical protein [Streptomyces sichuanensis]